MGQAVSERLKPRPLLVPKLATGSDWSELVENTTFETISLKHPEIKGLPDYSRPQPTGPFGMPVFTLHERTNSAFYRDRAEYLRFSSKLRPIRLYVLNEGTALASGVKFTIQVTDPARSIELAVGSDRPKWPRREWSQFDVIRPISMNKARSDIEVVKTNSDWTITAYFGKVQAKDTAITLENLFVGTSTSGSVDLPVSVFADELSTPVTAVLSIEYSVTEQEITVAKLTE